MEFRDLKKQYQVLKPQMDAAIAQVLQDCNFISGKQVAELEEKLTERLQGKDKNLFLDFCNAYGELMGESGLDSFLVGFRLGAKMIFDTFCSDDAPFASYLKE